MTDHLAALFFSSADGVGRGTYQPGHFDLHLRGGADLGDRLVHYHEAHHVVLTATTAWGGALLVAAGVPGWEQLFKGLLDRCRTTHESFATYLSCSVVAVGFGSPEAALASYPDYVALFERIEHYLAPVTGVQRRALAVTAMTRVCMQAPVLQEMIASWPTAITISALRRLDMPDERLEHLLRTPQTLLAALTAADEAVAEAFGIAALDADLGDGAAAINCAFDPDWALWEDTFFHRLAGELRRAGATVLDSNGHLGAAAELTALVTRALPASRLSVDAAPDAVDRRLTGIVLNHARLWLNALRLPGRVITVGDDVDLSEVVHVADATSRIEGRPNLVLSARLPERLLAGYDFPDSDVTVLSSLREPVVGVRSLADDGKGTDTDAMWLARLLRPADVTALVQSWDGRGDLSCCVAVSCLQHAGWREEWLPVLQRVGPLVWLIDVGVSSLADEFSEGRRVHGLYLDLGSSPMGARHGVVFKVEGLAGAWLMVADDVGIELLVQEVAGLPGIDLEMTGADWTQTLPVVRLVLLDLLRTESYIDLRGRSGAGSLGKGP